MTIGAKAPILFITTKEIDEMNDINIVEIEAAIGWAGIVLLFAAWAAVITWYGVPTIAKMIQERIDSESDMIERDS